MYIDKDLYIDLELPLLDKSYEGPHFLHDAAGRIMTEQEDQQNKTPMCWEKSLDQI